MIRRIRQVADVVGMIVGDLADYALLKRWRRDLGVEVLERIVAEQDRRIHKLEIEREARRQLEARNARLRGERVAS